MSSYTITEEGTILVNRKQVFAATLVTDPSTRLAIVKVSEKGLDLPRRQVGAPTEFEKLLSSLPVLTRPSDGR